MPAPKKQRHGCWTSWTYECIISQWRFFDQYHVQFLIVTHITPPGELWIMHMCRYNYAETIAGTCTLLTTFEPILEKFGFILLLRNF